MAGLWRDAGGTPINGGNRAIVCRRDGTFAM